MTTPLAGPVQAAPLNATAGDGSGGSNESGQGQFSVPIVPEGNAASQRNAANANGAGTPTTTAGTSAAPASTPGEGESTAKSDQNAEAKAQRNSQAGWQGITESLTKLNERLDKMEQGNPQAKEGEQPKPSGNDEQLGKLAETLAETNARLERMEFEREHPDLSSPELLKQWKSVNSDPKFKDFSMDERANYVRGMKGSATAGALQDQLSRAEGSMPAGSGGGSTPRAGNPLVDEETVAMGQAFGFSRKDLEEELS